MALVAVALFINGYLRIKRAKTIIDQQMVQIKEKNEELNKINEELQVTLEANTRQKEQIEAKNKEITDSIQYARYIQRAILPNVDRIRKSLPEHFVLIKPKQIISGDFYWVTEINNLHILAVADCTGHGVPGAFMSMLGISLLNEIINKENIIRPDLILQQMRNEVVKALNQKGNIGELRDGIALGICQIDFQNLKLKFAGANTPLYLIRDSEKSPLVGTIVYSSDDKILYEVKGDKMPIALSKKMDLFTLQEIDLIKAIRFTCFPYGFVDQFGGLENKRLQYRNFKDLLLKHCHQPMNMQKELLESDFTDWKDGHDQIDDVLVLGFRVI
jgi:hypothetical protein